MVVAEESAVGDVADGPAERSAVVAAAVPAKARKWRREVGEGKNMAMNTLGSFYGLATVFAKHAAGSFRSDQLLALGRAF